MTAHRGTRATQPLPELPGLDVPGPVTGPDRPEAAAAVLRVAIGHIQCARRSQALDALAVARWMGPTAVAVTTRTWQRVGARPLTAQDLLTAAEELETHARHRANETAGALRALDTVAAALQTGETDHDTAASAIKVATDRIRRTHA